jgi:ABC-type Fe3+-hydroxamate transport system substrate-binding protein
MKARTLLALVLVLVGAGAVVLLARHGSQVERAAAGKAPIHGEQAGATNAAAYDPTRIVSLAPAITETLFALGKGGSVVGVSLYSDYPAEAKQLPSVGAGTSPDLEAIARLKPTLILGEETKILPADKLAPLGPTKLLPWLTPAEIVASVRALGEIVGRQAEAEALAQRMEARWKAQPVAGAPRVLMLFGDSPGRLGGPLYFAKPGSLHDALLVAGGGKNAIEGEVSGMPTISVEGLLRLDPDAILLLVADDDLPAAKRAQYLQDFDELATLRAVRERRVRVLNGSILYVTGPRVMAVIDQVAVALGEMGFAAAAALAPAERPAAP